MFHVSYDDIISVENLLASWQEFLRGKRRRKDVAEFALHFLDHIFKLHQELKEKTYRHGGYESFKINDPKPRDIHKASVWDRLIHHAICRVLNSHFDRLFIHDSYSCRQEKGTHRAINRFREYGRKISRNDTITCWVLKGDIRKFFASIDHAILKRILARHVADRHILWLFDQIIDSFSTEGKSSVGLPLGNLTSQLLVNVYMDEFDQFMKREFHARYYIRYADDFVVLSDDRKQLEMSILPIAQFLENKLSLTLHPDKLFIKTLASGVDFLGWVHFPHHRVLRTSTRKRMFRNLAGNAPPASVSSYLGLVSHGNTHDIQSLIKKNI